MSRHPSQPTRSPNSVPSAVGPASIGRIFIILVFLLSLVAVSATSVGATTIPFTAEELLGKPTDTSITINIVPASAIEYYYEYDVDSGAPYAFQTGRVTAAAGQPSEVTLTGLSPNTRYYYRMVYDGDGDVDDGDYEARSEYSFWTQRAQGSTFKFTIISDSHAMYNAQYQQAMANIASDQPDFHFDLGDTFMLDSMTSQTAVNNAYLAQRELLYMDRIGHSAPIFLASGNHENEEGWNLDDAFSIAQASIQARKLYFPTPVTDGFYSGNPDPLAAIDEAAYGNEFREDYYAWEWGDALFVVFDPFQYTMANPYGATAGEGNDDPASGDRWNWTLGLQQYNWLKQTLENSTAKYKFMFAHHMLGGTQNYVRSGAVPAHMFEWGGYNADGTTWGFTAQRPTFGTDPIRQLMIDNDVSAFFHGHDHQYAYEVRDGIVYLSMPRPSTGLDFNYYSESDSYTERVLASPGHLRVTVAPDIATVEYVTSSGASGAAQLSFTIEPNTPAVTHNLTMAVSPDGAGTTTPAVGPHTYTENAVVNITATAALGYAFSNWTDGVADPNAASTTVTMDADKTVTANFITVPTYVLTTAVSPSGGGTISPTAGDHTYNQGTVVTVTATPNSGYTFSSWSGACTGSGTCSVTMDAAKSVTANFVAVTTITFTGAELLGRPTDTSISVSVVPDAAITLYYEYGTTSGVYTGQTAIESAAANQPKVMVIGCLTANTKYYYRMQYSTDGGSTWVTRPERSFQTQRAAGSSFKFTITSDSHVNILLGNATTWQNTLNDAAADGSDFHLDLGDTFDMRSRSVGDITGAENAYKYQLPFFNIVSHSAPIFLVSGNHEQQEAWHLIAGANSLNIIGTNAQKKFFLNPVPDGSFYTGDTSTNALLTGDQLKEDYYAWAWGDALFVVINPYWYTTTKPYVSDQGGGETDTTGSGDAWDWTLGQDQFNWLKATLEGSTAKYKFVFSHQMVSDASLSGQEDYGHAGANHAQYVEWGGYDEDGTTYGWNTKRTGWGSDPVHQILVKNGVSAFFHGHDHQYAYESRDGVVYQAVPSAGFTGSGFSMYTTGSGNTIQALTNSGHLLVTVGPSQASVDYIRTGATSSAYTYTIAPRGRMTLDGAVSSGTGAANSSSLSFSHTTGTGANRLLLVGVSWNAGTTARTISSVTFTPSGGSAVALTPVITQQVSGQNRYSAIYRWPASTALPSGQSGTVAVTFSGAVSSGSVVGAVNFAGVNQTTPLGTPAGAGPSSQGTAPTVTLTGLSGNELVFDNVFMGGSSSSQTLTAGAGQAQLWNAFVSNTRAAASTEKATGSSVTMSWTAASSAYWAIAAVPIKPAPAYDLTVAIDGGGTISPAVGVHTYTPGTIVGITPTPGAGYVFDYWSGACTGSGACSVTMDADKSVTAHFTVSVDVAITKPSNYPKLDWTHLAAVVDHYAVYRSLTAPYFTAGAASWLIDVPTSTPTHTDLTADLTVGGNQYFYLVGPVNGCGNACGSSNRTGAFVFGLAPGN